VAFPSFSSYDWRIIIMQENESQLVLLLATWGTDLECGCIELFVQKRGLQLSGLGMASLRPNPAVSTHLASVWWPNYCSMFLLLEVRGYLDCAVCNLEGFATFLT
jgi:phage replication-related protein YjqB (UPF0714/DUF867 family)